MRSMQFPRLPQGRGKRGNLGNTILLRSQTFKNLYLFAGYLLTVGGALEGYFECANLVWLYRKGKRITFYFDWRLIFFHHVAFHSR